MFIIFYSYYIRKHKTVMKTQNPSETESSQHSKCEEKPPLGGSQNYLNAQIDPEEAMKIVRAISQNIKISKRIEFQQTLKTIVKLIERGYASSFLRYPAIMIAMMKQFCILFRRIESEPQTQGKMIFVLSAIAQLIKQAGRFDFPFNEKFLKNIFTIDQELLENSPYRDGILAILGVIYQNISRQGRLLKKLRLGKEFKTIILTNYHLVNEGFSARLFNKSLYNLALQGQQITEAELHKYNVFETISKFLVPAQVNALISKIRSVLHQSKLEKEIKKESTQMIAQL